MKSSPILCYDHVTLRSIGGSGVPPDPDLTIQIVPDHEANAAQGRISREAPLGRAVLHRRCGDEVTIRVQDHAAILRILAVESRGSPAPELAIH